jgi:hypothetical protein
MTNGCIGSASTTYTVKWIKANYPADTYCQSFNAAFIPVPTTAPAGATITNPQFTYVNASNVQSGLAINAVSGIISADRSTVGTYSVTFTGTVTGCTVSSTSVVNVLDAPTFGSVSQAAPVCDGSTATINLTGLVPGNLSNIRYNGNYQRNSYSCGDCQFHVRSYYSVQFSSPAHYGGSSSESGCLCYRYHCQHNPDRIHPAHYFGYSSRMRRQHHSIVW